MRHVTRDTWHMTPDTWHVTLGGGWTICQNFSSLALLVWARKWFEDLEEKDRWLNQLISDEAVYRTAPATQGLLIILSHSSTTIITAFHAYQYISVYLTKSRVCCLIHVTTFHPSFPATGHTRETLDYLATIYMKLTVSFIYSTVLRTLKTNFN